MRILITGGAGFIGTNLAERLLKDGHHVHVLDNFSTGVLANVKRLGGHGRFSWAAGDVIDRPPFDSAYWPNKVDRIYNLASRASPKAYAASPLETLMTSTHGMAAVLEYARICSARVLQASTSEVYGDPAISPQRESYWGHVNPIGPRACYDEGKRVAETICTEYANTQGAQVRIARIFNTYGPFMQPDDGRVVSNFVTQALRGEALTVYGNGKQTRSLCYIDDTVEGMIRLMESPLDIPVNIGNPTEITMIQLAAAVFQATGQGRGTIIHKNLPTDDPRRRCPDISRAKWALYWEPKVELAKGLSRTVAYFREIAT